MNFNLAKSNREILKKLKKSELTLTVQNEKRKKQVLIHNTI